jgi:hypothetical protein
MIRWVFLLITACFAACSGPPRSLEETIPVTVNEWKRVSTSPVTADGAPAIVRQLGLRRAIQATYEGPSMVTVRIYEMNVATSAFELIQKWSQQDGPAVYSGPYFIVAEAPPQAAAGLLEGLQKQLK